jgi:hypothetical protein
MFMLKLVMLVLVDVAVDVDDVDGGGWTGRFIPVGYRGVGMTATSSAEDGKVWRRCGEGGNRASLAFCGQSPLSGKEYHPRHVLSSRSICVDWLA